MIDKLYSVAKNGLFDIKELIVVKETPKTYVVKRPCDNIIKKSTMQNRWELFYTDYEAAACTHAQITSVSRDIPAPQWKSCPFCDGKAVKFGLRHVEVTHKISFRADFGCEKCNALMIGLGKTPEEAWNDAIEKWERRTSDAK